MDTTVVYSRVHLSVTWQFPSLRQIFQYLLQSAPHSSSKLCSFYSAALQLSKVDEWKLLFKFFFSVILASLSRLRLCWNIRVLARQCSCSPDTCNPEASGLPVLSNVLITHPILRIWPRRTTICSLDWKNNWKVAIFRPTGRSLLSPRPGWTDKLLNFFWVACRCYSNGLRSVLSFVGSVLNKYRVWSL